MEEKKKILPNDEVKDEELDDVVGGIKTQESPQRPLYCSDCHVIVKPVNNRYCPNCGKWLLTAGRR